MPKIFPHTSLWPIVATASVVPSSSRAATQPADRAELRPASAAAAGGNVPARLEERLRAGGFTGAIHGDDATRSAYAADYGKLVTGKPMLVVKPKTPEDVQRLVHLAIREKVTIRARSGGHGLEGQAVNKDGIVAVLDDLRLPSGAKIELDTSGPQPLVRTVPGVRMGEVTRFLAEKGLRLRVATMDDYPGIGGALSAAGTGRGSHRHGTMTDHCMRLVGVTGTGARIDVSSERQDYSQFGGPDGAIADLMLGSFGQAGIITEASFPVVKVKGELRRFREPMPSLEAMRARVDQVIRDSGDEVWAVYGVIAKNPTNGKPVYLATTVRDVSDGSGDPITSVPDPGASPDVVPAWLSVIFPDTDGALKALAKHPEFVDGMTNPGLILLIPQKKARPDRLTLNNWSKAQTGDLMMGLGVFYYGNAAEAAKQVDVFRANRKELVHELGGQQYLTEGVPRQSPTAAAEWREILGADAFTRIVNALDKADPFGVFARLPGLERQAPVLRPARG